MRSCIFRSILLGSSPLTMPNSQRRNPATVLLVDDNDSMRTVLTELLTRKGYRTFEAASPERALHLVKQFGNELDVLVTDIVMPGMNGFELSKRVRRLCPKIGIIHMSVYGVGETPDPQSGSDVVLSKPIPINVLVEALEKVLRRDPTQAE